MRGPEKQAIVCRTQDGLIEKIDNLKFSKTSHSSWNIPFLRGIVIFIDSMVNGVRALSYSANLLPEDEQESENKFDLWIENHFTEEKSQKVITYTAVILGVLLAAREHGEGGQNQKDSFHRMKLIKMSDAHRLTAAAVSPAGKSCCRQI